MQFLIYFFLMIATSKVSEDQLCSEQITEHLIPEQTWEGEVLMLFKKVPKFI